MKVQALNNTLQRMIISYRKKQVYTDLSWTVAVTAQIQNIPMIEYFTAEKKKSSRLDK